MHEITPKNPIRAAAARARKGAQFKKAQTGVIDSIESMFEDDSKKRIILKVDSRGKKNTFEDRQSLVVTMQEARGLHVGDPVTILTEIEIGGKT